jgi:exopolyphosphatase/guanosine-5'-triphosphate,3'-diphosphate pyrophosphatase
MLVAETSPGAEARTLAEERQVMRLGASVFHSGRISHEAIEAVATLLGSMAATYRSLDVLAARAVATSAVRDASNQHEFIARASEAAGTPVEIISGQEEARLIHLGVQAKWPHPEQRILIIDVGGGSAEFILAEEGEMTAAFSRPLGAVRLTEVFLKHDPPDPLELHQMEEYIAEKFALPLRRLAGLRFDRAIATSASAAAVVSAANRVSRQRREAADRMRADARQVRQVYRRLSESDLAARRKTPGIGPRRAEIIIAGAAVFRHAMDELRLPSLYYSTAGVRDGIIADLAGKEAGAERTRLDRDQRRVVEEMARRYGVSVKHARKVAQSCRTLFAALIPLHGLAPEEGKALEAAAYLHDIGHFVSDTGHHKHSAYLVANSELPGFTHDQRVLIALLCRFHRKSMPSVRHEPFQALTPERRRALQLLTPLLRLADSLDRSHDQRVDAVQVAVADNAVTLTLHSELDTDLERWAAERTAAQFQEIYGRRLALVPARGD